MKRISRRKFIKGSLGAVTVSCYSGFVGLCIYNMMGNTPSVREAAISIANYCLTIDLAKEPILNQIGGAAKVRDKKNLNGSIIIACVDKDNFIASSLFCTHGTMEVEYHHEESLFRCVSICKSEFKLTGEVINGPTTKYLKSYPIKKINEKLLIKT